MSPRFLKLLLVRKPSPSASAAVQKLWSPDMHVRNRAVREVLRAGTSAIEPLVRLLYELVEDQRPRFATGREEDGNKVLEEVLRAPSLPSPWIALEHLRRSSIPQESPDVFINARLMEDVMRLLGQLKAVDATPLLIRIMLAKRGIFQTRREDVGPEMLALRQIGASTVPYLLTAIDAVRQGRYRPEDILIGCVVTRTPPGSDYDDGDEGTAGARFEDASELGHEDEEVNELTLANLSIALRYAVCRLNPLADQRSQGAQGIVDAPPDLTGGKIFSVLTGPECILPVISCIIEVFTSAPTGPVTISPICTTVPFSSAPPEITLPFTESVTLVRSGINYMQHHAILARGAPA